MSLIAKRSGGGNAKPLEAGSYPAVCIGLIDIGRQYNKKFDKYEEKVIIQWELIGETIMVDGKEVNRIIRRPFTNSLNSKSNLYKFLVAWRGRDFTDEEFSAFDLRNILGAPCVLTIANTERDGKIYSSVVTVGKMMKGMTVTRTLPLTCFDVDEDPLEMIDEMPEWIAEQIRASENYKERIEKEAGSASDNGLSYDGPAELTEEDDEDGVLPF